jgi:uncharacterized cofD-like protein
MSTRARFLFPAGGDTLARAQASASSHLPAKRLNRASFLIRMRFQGKQISGTSRLRRRAVLLMQPGIGIKRWLVVGAFGVLLLALGMALAVSFSVSSAVVEVGRTVTFRNLGATWRGVIVGGMGIFWVSLAGLMLYRRLVFGAQYIRGGSGIIENLTSYRVRSDGPRIVALGGGTGLSSLLRGLKSYSENITAIVTVADDGGSSGQLRSELGIPPPGDARQCLIALSESEPLMEEMLSYRFDTGGTLQGHSMGNLLLAALADTRGSLHGGLAAAGELLAVRGQVAPSSISPDVKLMARTKSGKVLHGESAIGHVGEEISALWLEPEDALPNEAAISAIERADTIVIGPGSLYTSLLPNFLVPGIAEAVERSSAPIVLVCNIATQYGETDRLSASDHLRIFESFARVGVTHFLLNARILPIGSEHHQDAIESETYVEGFSGSVIAQDLVDEHMPTRHDPLKLSSAVNEIARRGSRAPERL